MAETRKKRTQESYDRPEVFLKPYTCNESDCENEGHTGGKCKSHYQRSLRKGTIDTLHSCKTCGSSFYGKLSRVYCQEECRKEGNRKNQRAKNAAKYASLQRFLKSIKLTCGCVDCEYVDNVYALQFDHIRDKSFKIATARSIAAAVEELEKCEVRCANCHAIKTQERYECGLLELTQEKQLV